MKIEIEDEALRELLIAAAGNRVEDRPGWVPPVPPVGTVCTAYGCAQLAVANVRGGRTADQPTWMGWRGAKCAEHAVDTVRLQMFQVEHGMPITIEPVGAPR